MAQVHNCLVSALRRRCLFLACHKVLTHPRSRISASSPICLVVNYLFLQCHRQVPQALSSHPYLPASHLYLLLVACHYPQDLRFRQVSLHLLRLAQCLFQCPLLCLGYPFHYQALYQELYQEPYQGLYQDLYQEPYRESPAQRHQLMVRLLIRMQAYEDVRLSLVKQRVYRKRCEKESSNEYDKPFLHFIR